MRTRLAMIARPRASSRPGTGAVDAALGVGAPHRPASARRGLAYHFDVVVHLVRLDLQIRHRGSVLGWVWSLGPALFQLGATYFVFTRVIPLGIESYPIFLLVGILPWYWFSRSINEATTSLEASRDLVLRPGFATELLPLAAVLVGLVDYVLALPVMLTAVGLTVGLHVEVLLLPALLAIQLMLTLGLGLLLAPLQAFLRDVRHIVGVALQLGFWLTPVFYRRRQVPESVDFLYRINPMGHLVEGYRAILFEGRLPDGSSLVWVTVAAIAVLGAGLMVFERLKHAVPEQL